MICPGSPEPQTYMNLSYLMNWFWFIRFGGLPSILSGDGSFLMPAERNGAGEGEILQKPFKGALSLNGLCKLAQCGNGV